MLLVITATLSTSKKLQAKACDDERLIIHCTISIPIYNHKINTHQNRIRELCFKINLRHGNSPGAIAIVKERIGPQM